MTTEKMQRLLSQLPPDTDPKLVNMFVLVHSELSTLPEHFECSTLFDHEYWEQLDPGLRKEMGRILSQLACKPFSPIERFGFTSERHNSYRRK